MNLFGHDESLLVNFPPLASVPDLRRYDIIAVAVSGGKDSHQALYQTVRECGRQGVSRSRVIAIHADLGDVEWDGVPELAEEHARLCGVEFMKVARHGRIVKRSGKCYKKGETYGTILDHAQRNGFWPRRDSRFCTSDHKRDQILRAIRSRARKRRCKERAICVLNVMGLRGAESRERARRQAFKERDARSSSKTLIVDQWNPIFAWSASQVWAAEWAVGHPWHPAYDWGLPRLSCSFCVLSGKDALRLAAFLRPEMASAYGIVESEIGRTLQSNTSPGCTGMSAYRRGKDSDDHHMPILQPGGRVPPDRNRGDEPQAPPEDHAAAQRARRDRRSWRLRRLAINLEITDDDRHPTN